jgi:adenylate cyclase
MGLTSEVVPARTFEGRVRVGVWVGHMALPLLAAWLLFAQPDIDIMWEHRPSHFWLVMAVAAVNVVLALQILKAARTRQDARLLLAGYAFVVAAGFLLLHALATPGVILDNPNAGFVIATPVGLAGASLFFALSSLQLRPATSARLIALDPVIKWSLIALMVLWGVVSLAGLPPLADPVEELAEGPLALIAGLSIGLYAFAAVQYFASHRRKPSVMLVALITAAVLLAQSQFTVIWTSRSWQLSWWLWHILMAAAFGFVAYSAYSQYRKEGGGAGIFDGIVGQATAETIRQEYGGALETLTDTLQRSSQMGMTDQDLDLIIAGLGTRFALTEGQTEVLARAARSLATERDQGRRLGALAVIATETFVDRSEDELLERTIQVVGERFFPDVVRVGIVSADGLVFPDRLATGAWPGDADRHTRDLTVAGERTGVVEFARPGGRFDDRDITIMDTLVAEIGIALENVRLYRQLDTLFQTYLSPDVARTLKADPSQADLGGSITELTALFADIRGFTTFSEKTDPTQVTELVNRYFGIAVPIIFRHGGTVVQFVGDALLAVFDAPTPRPNHEFRAAVSALEIQAAIAATNAGAEDAPQFRIGINTGPALVGNIGSDELRSFNVLGDAVNVASRLETSAEPGTVLIGEATYRAIADRVRVSPLGAIQLKGKEVPIETYRLERIVSHSDQGQDK